MPANNYKCIKCGDIQTSSYPPLLRSCRKGGLHDWIIEDGKQKNYLCINCGNGQTAITHPLIGVCNKGDGHLWIQG